MILELCQLAQEFLSSKNKRPEASMHEGMIKKKVEKEDHEKVRLYMVKALYENKVFSVNELNPKNVNSPKLLKKMNVDA